MKPGNNLNHQVLHEEPVKTEASESHYDVIVIGAGARGLTAAALLSKAGKKVLVVEKEARPGGLVAPLVYDSYQFDTAARLIMGCGEDSPLGPGPIFTLLNKLGVYNQCEFIKVQPFCTMIFPDMSFQMWSGRQAFIDGLRKVFPQGLDKLPDLLELCSRFYKGFLFYETISSLWGMFVKPFQSLALLRYKNLTLENALSRFIPDLQPRTAVASLWPYIGLTPARSSFLMWAIMMSSYIEEGAYFCRGGLHRLADAIAYSLTNDGGELIFRNEVTRILVENGSVRGVHLENGQKVFAPVVLSNIDCRHIFSDMIDPLPTLSRYKSKLKRLEPSVKALNISMVTDLDLPALGFGFETLFFDTWDMEYVWNNLIEGDIGMFTLTITSIADPSLSPSGQHLISSTCGLPENFIPSPDNIQRTGMLLFSKIRKQIPALENHLTISGKGTLPPGFITQDFSSMYGWAATPGQIGMGRLIQRTPLKGLYLAGHWTQPSHGVMPVILSGMTAARAILK
jgi:phytoene dehydrogenase-like protein